MSEEKTSEELDPLASWNLEAWLGQAKKVEDQSVFARALVRAIGLLERETGNSREAHAMQRQLQERVQAFVNVVFDPQLSDRSTRLLLALQAGGNNDQPDWRVAQKMRGEST